MKKSATIFESEEEIRGFLPRGKEWIHYRGVLTVKYLGKKPVSLKLTFVPPHPFAIEVPEEHCIRTESITDVYVKLIKLFKKLGFELR